jgi:hypothetical protein
VWSTRNLGQVLLCVGYLISVINSLRWVLCTSARSRITKYIFSSTTPNLLSVLDPVSTVACDMSATPAQARKQSSLLSKIKHQFLRIGVLFYLGGPTRIRTSVNGFGDRHSTTEL